MSIKCWVNSGAVILIINFCRMINDSRTGMETVLYILMIHLHLCRFINVHTYRHEISISAMLLDLGLRGAAVTIKPTHGAWTLDFPAFLELYSHQCGLSIPGIAGHHDGIWIPTATGMWEEVIKHVHFRLDY